MAAVFAKAEQSLFSKPQERIFLWLDTLKGEIYDREFLDSNAAKLASLVISTSSYEDRASSQAVVTFVKESLKRSDVFLKAFAAALVKGSSSVRSNADAISFLRWISIVVLFLPESSGKKAAAKLLEVASTPLNLLYSSPHLRWPAARRSIVSLLSQRPDLLLDAVASSKSSSANGSVVLNVGMIAAVLDVIIREPFKKSGSDRSLPPSSSSSSSSPAAPRSRVPETLRIQVKDEMLKLFCSEVIGGKERPSRETLFAFRRLLAALTVDDVSNVLVPAFVRVLRRQSDVAMTALAYVPPMIQIDFSSFAAELIPLIIQQLRSKESVRALALDSLRSIAQAISNHSSSRSSTSSNNLDLVAKQAVSIRAILDGSAEAKPKAVGERVTLALALQALAEAFRVRDFEKKEEDKDAFDVAPVAESICVSLANVIKDEPMEEAKIAALGALGVWLPRCSAVAPAVVTQIDQGAQKDPKEVVRRAYLRTAVNAVVESPHLRPSFKAMAETTAAKVVTDSLTKPLLRFDGIQALLLALLVLDDTVSTPLWTAAVKADSLLLHPSNASRYQGTDARVVLALVSALLSPHQAALRKKALSAEAAACRLLVAALVVGTKETRALAKATARRLMSEGGGVGIGGSEIRRGSEIAAALVAAAAFWTANSTELPALAVESGVSGGISGSSSSSFSSSSFSSSFSSS
eukprot:CAMPEP_0175064988 /NCGR_PEP_ID=MMETSP0052_2-20121109/15656_1 /TAXON_ID=51329 ORGANISM="Polytomella parva, Strain SAG 63-3" /NCGR_SAMPLE_ID=MMETSP0052_2 /ASSEMBLY_ACC=CAM_ASM_000194 /LENGTH=692 /DNA_ID=CAMNT_0016331435 /DNA_START=88 /DNA_END=2162 /DNA_ORIENTATION=-